MSTLSTPASSLQMAPSRAALWSGRIMSGLCIAFLLFDAIFKFFKPQVVVEGTVKLGFSENVITPLGVILLISTLLYAFPRTAILGAILLTGYLGGAVATHLRMGDPLLSHILFPVYVGVLLWLGLYLRVPSLRAHLIPCHL